jgi:CBS domain-containing protein
MNVSEIMTPDPLTVQADASVRDAARIMREHHIGGLPVLKGTRLVGMVTDSDLLALLSTRPPSEDLWLPSPLEIIEVPIREYINWEKTKAALTDIGTMPVSRVMSEPPITISEEAPIEDAAALMLREGIVRLPVMREAELVGIVTRSDIVQGLATGREPAE